MQWPYETWGATAVFAGHDHVYERIITADGNGDGNDFVYLTTGAGGRSLYNFPPPAVVSLKEVECTAATSRLMDWWVPAVTRKSTTYRIVTVQRLSMPLVRA